jgi:hypothetical protein
VRDYELPAKKMYEEQGKILAEKSPEANAARISWSELPQSVKEQYMRMADTAICNSPAPIHFKLETQEPWPGQGFIKMFYSDTTPEAVEALVQEFREFVQNYITDRLEL